MGMTALVCKPLFALCGSVHVALGTAACITWVTYAKVRAGAGVLWGKADVIGSVRED